MFILVHLFWGILLTIRSLVKLRKSSITTTSLVKKSPTKMPLLESFAFAILTGPAVVFYDLLSFWISPDGTLRFLQLGILTYGLSVANCKLTNHAVNFLCL